MADTIKFSQFLKTIHHSWKTRIIIDLYHQGIRKLRQDIKKIVDINIGTFFNELYFLEKKKVGYFSGLEIGF